MPVRLPLDVLHSIFEFVDDKETLRNLLTVSRLSKKVAEPLLYTDVEIHQNLFKDSIAQFRSTITAGDGHLAFLVKQLSITIHAHGSGRYGESIIATIRKLVNIQRLCLNCTLFLGPVINPPSFGLASLTHLIWEANMAKTNEFAVFLENLPKLEYLQATSFRSSITLSPDALPNLRALVSSLPFAVSVLPGRHVIHLDVDFDLYSPVHELYDTLSLDTLHHVRTLAVWDELDRIIPFVSCFDNVEYLMMSTESVGPEAKLDGILSSIDMLRHAKIKYLKFEILSGVETVSAEADVQNIFRELPSLRVFDLCVDELCERYDRDGSSRPLRFGEHLKWGLWWQQCEGIPDLG